MSIRSSLLPAGPPRAAFGMIVLNESRIARRLPLGLLVGVALPTVLLVIIGSVRHNRQHLQVLGGLTTFTVYVPVFLAMVIAALAFYGLPIPLAIYRDQGILRRLSVTPVPPAWVLAAQLVLNVSFTAAELILLLVVAMTGFGVAAPKSAGGLVLALSLSIAGVFAIGLWVSAIARPRTAGILVAVCFFPLMFFGGLFLPRGNAEGAARRQQSHPARRGGPGDPERHAERVPPHLAAARAARVRGHLQRAGGALLPLGVTGY